MTSVPCTGSGRNGSGGALRITAQTFSSVGIFAANSRYLRSTVGASSNENTSRPHSTWGPTGCSLNSKRVTTPKLPPPPRSAQNSSGFSVALATTCLPSAVTTSADSRLSTVRPCLRDSQPKPPPSVSPATPVVELMPSGVASPKACAS